MKVLNESSLEIDKYLSGLVICVVDDSRSFLAGIGELLRPYHCNVHLFVEPRKAVDEISALNPDIVITDYEMGDTTGLELIQQLRAVASLRTVPILVLTGREDSNVIISTMLGGADSFVSKSSVRDVLVAKLVSLARVRRLHQEVIRLKQFTAIKSMIATYKHEFGNVLAILSGRIQKLERAHPQLSGDETVESIKKNLQRMDQTLQKLAQLKEYEEEPYSDKTTLLKVG